MSGVGGPENLIVQRPGSLIEFESGGKLAASPQVGAKRVSQVQGKGIPRLENSLGAAQRFLDELVGLRRMSAFPERVAEMTLGVKNGGVIGAESESLVHCAMNRSANDWQEAKSPETNR